MAQHTQKDPWGGITEAIRVYHHEQERQTKNFLQDVADSLKRDIDAAKTGLIVWFGCIVAILAASVAALGIRVGFGFAAVTIVLLTAAYALWGLRWLRTRVNLLHAFRERFRRRAGDPFDLSWLEMREEDREFLEKCKDAILWPSVVAYERRRSKNQLDADEIEHLNTLIADSEGGHSHLGPSENDTRCELCAAAKRVRENVEAALSALGSSVESIRQTLAAATAKIDPELAFDKRFRDWMDWVSDETKETSALQLGRGGDNGSQPRLFLATICEKNEWNFDEADRVREIARIGGEWQASDYSDYERGKFSSQLFDDLSRKLQDASTASGASELWRRYDGMRDWLAKKRHVIERVRNIVGRYHPDTMFRELNELFGGIQVQLPGIEKWGYDAGMVEKQRKIAEAFMAKNRDAWDRERERQLRAARAVILAESARGRYRCTSAPSRKRW